MKPARKRQTRPEIKFLSPNETAKLYQAISRDCSIHAARNKAIFHLAKYCALRASEIGSLRMADYNVITHCIYCRRLKGSKSNTIKIVDSTVLEYLDAYYHARLKIAPQNPFLFPSQKGSPINRRTLDELMKMYGSVGNLDKSKRHFHVLKHTRAMELIDYAGVQLRDVQWWLGHKSINNTMVYLDYTFKAQERLFEQLSEIEGKGGLYAYQTPQSVCNINTCCT